MENTRVIWYMVFRSRGQSKMTIGGMTKLATDAIAYRKILSESRSGSR